MRSATFAMLLVLLALSGCSKSAPPVSGEKEPTALDARAKPLQCEKYAGTEQHVEKCVVEILVTLPTDQEWSRFGCYGELEFSQVYEGRVSTPEQGFYAGFEKQPQMKVGDFPLISFVYFPEGYGALDPSLKWYECKVWYANSPAAA